MGNDENGVILMSRINSSAGQDDQHPRQGSQRPKRSNQSLKQGNQRVRQGSQPIKKGKEDKKGLILRVILIVLILILVALVIYIIQDSLSGDQRYNDGFEPNDNGDIHDLMDPDPTPEPVPILPPRPSPEFIGEPDSINPLTGEPMHEILTRNRPIAIVLANTTDDLPLNGVSQVDILYEILVEGGITRFLAIYQDPNNASKIGCIRSARHYTVELAESYDAILLTAGGSPQALSYVRSSGVPHLNEVEGPHREVFFRDRNRIPGRRIASLHSVVTTSERLWQWLPEYNFRLEHEDGFVQPLLFVEDATPAQGSAATEVSVRFSGAKTTSFTFDSRLRTYHVKQFNREFVDANDNSRPEFTNILILRTSVTAIRGDAAGRQNMVTTGTGEGFFVNGGRYIEINWSREDNSSQFVYTHRDGTPLELGIGKTFICIVPNNVTPTFS